MEGLINTFLGGWNTHSYGNSDAFSHWQHENGQPNLVISMLSRLGAPAALVSHFGPKALELHQKYPRAAKMICVPVALWFGSQYLFSKRHEIWQWMMSKAMSSIVVSANDTRLHTNVTNYLASKTFGKWEKALSAYSANYLKNNGRKVHGDDGVLFEGDSRIQFFREDNRMFVMTKSAYGTATTTAVDLKLWCLGWSPAPIKKLITDLNKKGNNEEVVRLHTPSDANPNTWQIQSTSASRGMDTIYLESDKKAKLIADIEDYLTDPEYYTDNGIPYRRGYLLYGKPGCGKSSFAMAMAGRFKLDVYTLSLLDPRMNDSTLLHLFQCMQPGSLILLEDIDSAGIGRQLDQPKEEAVDAIGKSPKADQTDATDKDAKAKQTKRKAASKPRSNVTLAGLLNIMDGAPAPSGHVLLMTSNHPETLDEAMIRPGRIDVKVEFEYASREQARDLFLRMNTPSREDMVLPYDIATVPELAEIFADRVPERQFSPAALQQFVLLHKRQPQKAVDSIEQWVKIGLAERAVGERRELDRAQRGLMRMAVAPKPESGPECYDWGHIPVPGEAGGW